MANPADSQAPDPTGVEAAQQVVDSVETGARQLHGRAGRVLAGVALVWSLFQLWIASPFPYMLADYIPLLNDSHTRSFHLSFAIFLAFIAFPAWRRSKRDQVPWHDWGFGVVGVVCTAYLAVFAEELSTRPGLPIFEDLLTAGIGLILLLEATRRALGWPLMIVALVFLSYVFFGQHAPDIIAWKGASFEKAMSHMWITQEGVFGIGLGISTSFIFLFVLFGALLEKAGAGNYFTKIAFALLGHYRGGPAKAAVVSSGMNGMISGSSIANVVITGTFTIPLMKRVGFPPEKAGAVEVAASTNGQLMPPIMGAAAFLMIEYVGISYIEVIKHAFLPAVISYIALVYIVHLEALKAGMQGLPPRRVTTLLQKLTTFLMVVLGLMILSGITYYGFGWVKQVAGDASAWIAGVILLLAYFGLVWVAAQAPDLEVDDPNRGLLELPELGPTVRSGLHFLLPVAMLIWCLTVERFSPGLSAFWAVVLLIVLLITQHPLKAWFRRHESLGREIGKGLRELRTGLIFGARNMIGIGVAVATAGIVVGTVTLTGIGLVMTEFVEFISGGNLMLMLLFTAFMCLILGMGLPTTANYIVVSSLIAPVIVTLGAQNGLLVPLIAVHMFVFYFGILADDTPPVGLAAFAASAIAHSDPIRTGIQGFTYDIRTAILPFLFIFNTELLLIGIESLGHLLVTIASAVAAMLLFAAATQGFFFARSRWWETLALLLIAFTLFRPGFWMDRISPPTHAIAPAHLLESVVDLPAGAEIRLRAEGLTLEGDEAQRTVVFQLPAGNTVAQRFSELGLAFRTEDSSLLVDAIEFGSAAEQAGLDFDWVILGAELSAEQPAKQWMFLPALLLLAGIIWRQRSRA